MIAADGRSGIDDARDWHAVTDFLGRMTSQARWAGPCEHPAQGETVISGPAGDFFPGRTVTVRRVRYGLVRPGITLAVFYPYTAAPPLTEWLVALWRVADAAAPQPVYERGLYGLPEFRCFEVTLTCDDGRESTRGENHTVFQLISLE